MGCSADSELIYGFTLGSSGYDDNGDRVCPDEILEGDWEEVFAKKMNIKDADWKVRSEALKKANVELAFSGDMQAGYTTSHLSHKEASKNYWNSGEITVDDLTVKPHWEQELRAFCELMGIPWQEPKFMILSSYG